MHTHLNTHIYVHTHTQTHMPIHTCTAHTHNILLNTHIYCIYTHINPHVYKHMYSIHIHTHKPMCPYTHT